MKHEMKQQVDADGILRFSMELGEEFANKLVCLSVASIEPLPDTSLPSKKEGEKLSDDPGGKWVGDFPRIARGKIMRAGADGVVRVPLGKINADKRVYVTVEILQPTAEAEAQQRAERRRFIEEMAGIITDPTFVRHPQGEFEKRDEL